MKVLSYPLLALFHILLLSKLSLAWDEEVAAREVLDKFYAREVLDKFYAREGLDELSARDQSDILEARDNEADILSAREALDKFYAREALDKFYAREDAFDLLEARGDIDDVLESREDESDMLRAREALDKFYAREVLDKFYAREDVPDMLTARSFPDELPGLSTRGDSYDDLIAREEEETHLQARELLEEFYAREAEEKARLQRRAELLASMDTREIMDRLKKRMEAAKALDLQARHRDDQKYNDLPPEGKQFFNNFMSSVKI